LSGARLGMNLFQLEAGTGSTFPTVRFSQLSDYISSWIIFQPEFHP
jgi:hypothetical protein